MNNTSPDAPALLKKTAWIGWGLLVFFIPLQLHYNYILNAFYYYGATYNDAGLFAHLYWHNSWSFMNPHLRGDYSYLGVHFTPFLILLSQLSYFLPTHMVEFLAAFTAATYASLGLALFIICCTALKPSRHWQIAGLALMAIGFAFNTVIGLGMWMPHFEYAIPLGILLFLFCYIQNYRVLAGVFFVFTLSLREDAGLHMCAVLGLLTLIKYWETRSWPAIKILVQLIACATLYSLLAFLIIYLLCNYYHADEVASYIYFGSPPFSHISWPLLMHRAHDIAHQHVYLWSGFWLMAVWSAYTRNPYLMVGFAANIPWFFLNWFANNDNTGYLYCYYGFPFVLSIGWPVIAAMWRYGPRIPKPAIKEALWLQAALISLALITWENTPIPMSIGPGPTAWWGSFQLQPSTNNRQAIYDFSASLDEGAGNLGVIAASASALSLLPEKYQGRYLMNMDAPSHLDSIFYVQPRPTIFDQAIQEAIIKNHLIHHYNLNGTSLYLSSNRSSDELGVMAPSFQELP